ncbi:hypothetical protein [Morganella morganii IS15]|nr:hypothetical protein CSB69_4336 [Morganella morganii]EMP51446.1 hypothetical protein C790_01161 [Morganella morganii SC01]CDK64689.1 hypothetical protein [Morganella morganii IS15]
MNSRFFIFSLILTAFYSPDNRRQGLLCSAKPHSITEK